MADQFKLKTGGTCGACNVVAVAADNLECYLCKGMFHVNCPKVADADRVGTKSLITQFIRPSTKKNFKFFCDCCLTKFEVDLASNDNRRLHTVEDNITSIKSELEDIKKLLKENATLIPAAKQEETRRASPVDNIWFNKERLESTKVAPAEPMLVLENSEVINESVEKAILDNSIPVVKSYKNNSGELVVVCDTEDSRDNLQRIIASVDGNIEMKSSTKKKPSITIVGLSKKYSEVEIVNQLVSQNQFIKQFATVNHINEHLEIHDVKPTRAKPDVFQVFASVSEALRKGIGNYKDKLIIGLSSCKVYDRFHVKRCNNCQEIGHYYKQCSTPSQPCCAKCSQDHATNSCTATVHKCINCSKANRVSDHTAYDPKCPALVSALEKKKTLNSQRRAMENK